MRALGQVGTTLPFGLVLSRQFRNGHMPKTPRSLPSWLLGVVPLPRAAKWSTENSLMMQFFPVAIIGAISGFEVLDVFRRLARELTQ